MIELATAEIIDCQGHVSHRLTLEVDGTVTITYLPGSRVVRVDPARRHCLTPGASVGDALLDQAAALCPW